MFEAAAAARHQPPADEDGRNLCAKKRMIDWYESKLTKLNLRNANVFFCVCVCGPRLIAHAKTNGIIKRLLGFF
jgi:hypothetical protein